MIYAVGIDSLEIERIDKLVSNDIFINKVFSNEEKSEFLLKNNSSQSIAAAFCAKEAFSKAIRTGILGFSMKEVSLLHDENNAPYIKLCGNAKKIADKLKLNFHVSVTHDDTYATCIVISERSGKSDS